MSPSSHRLKERHKKSSRHSLNDDESGTAARTRRLSFEEIMLRRKRKGLSENLKDGAVEAESRLGDIKDNVSLSIESERGHRHQKDSLSADERRVAEKERNISSGKKEKISHAEDKSEENHMKGKDREVPTVGRKLKSVVSRPSHDMSDGIKRGKNDEQVRDKRENDKRPVDRARNEAAKRHSRDSRGKESHAERGGRNSERESKRKYHNEEDGINKDRYFAKKLDMGKHFDAEISERSKRKESSKQRVEEQKTRRRSRSRDRDDRHRRSRSPSTRAHKRLSHNRTVDREVSPHNLKGRSQKQNHIDRNKLPSNGSSGHYCRHDEGKSGLGGYSPRKRISEAAAKTPPPPDHSSPEKKSAKWDIPPSGINKTLSGSVISNFQSSNSNVSTIVQELAATAQVVLTPAKLPSSVFAAPLSTKMFSSVDSIQLTQATRPVRRLYVDNVPSSTTEKDLVKWINDLFLSSGVNHIPGTQPCINCIINKEKAQALVEFLTPEHASTALSFDGISISGSVLRIRRPKDFVEVATGNLDKSAPVVDTVSDLVKDSPNKIFIGGISKALSPKLLMEIVSSFGPLKAYHYEVNGDLNEPRAFLEYADQSVTLKACSGLNGMKIGGKVLTVVQALRDDETLAESSPLYEIPQHAKPLLKQPTHVLKLKSVFNVEDLSALPKPEVEEILEDIRLECSRFGNVKSVNVIKQRNSLNTNTEICEFNYENLGCENISLKTENLEQHINNESNEAEPVKCLSNVKELQEDEEKDMGIGGDKLDGTEEKSPQPSQPKIDDVPFEVIGSENDPSIVLEELPNQPNSPKQLSEHLDDKDHIDIPIGAAGPEKEFSPEESLALGNSNSSEQEVVDGLDLNTTTEHEVTKKQGVKIRDSDLENIFELGCVFVEFGRTEAARMAAHCLHGRVFDARTVSVEYVSVDHYKSRFPK